MARSKIAPEPLCYSIQSAARALGIRTARMTLAVQLGEVPIYFPQGEAGVSARGKILRDDLITWVRGWSRKPGVES